MAVTSDERRFREAMGRFATGVTIVSTRDGDQVRAMTANGFLSVSLEPQLILISVRNASRMLETIERAGQFGVSVLAASQRDLSDHFAGRPNPELVPAFTELEGVPVVDGALAQIATTVDAAHLAGDHTLFVGRVAGFEMGEGDPLIYHGGAYRALMEQLEWTSGWEDAEVQWY